MHWLDWLIQKAQQSSLPAPKRGRRPIAFLRVEELEPRVTPTGNIAITNGAVVDANDNPLAVVNAGNWVYIQADFATQSLPSNASYRVALTVNGLTLDSSYVTWGAGTSGAGSWNLYWGTFLATPGTNQVIITVNPDHSVAETSYADNTTSFTFNASSAPVGTFMSYTPAQIRTAYGINSIPNFSSATPDGSGQTIALDEAGNDPNIITDLDSFDKAMSLTTTSTQTLYQQYGPASSLVTVYNQSGTNITANIGTSGSNGVPAEDPTGHWEGEETLDVEWAHAIAPGARIDIIEVNDDASWPTNLLTGDALAASLPGVSAISNSWGLTEWSGENVYDSSTFVTPSGHTGVTFLTASNDNGANVYGAFGPSVGNDGYYPATSPNVVSVGGTELTLNNDAYGSETGWSFPAPTSTVNNGSSSYTQTGSWTSHSGGFSGTYSTAAGGSSGSAVWTLAVTPANTGWGTEVAATWTASPGNATAATYTIYDGTQASGTILGTIAVDQTRAPVGAVDGTSPFQELGVFFPTLTNATGTLTVVLNASSANGTVVADAVGGAPAWASTGGPTRFESEPSYQTPFQSTGYRTNPDVSFDASQNSGVTTYYTPFNNPANAGLSYGSFGTSLSSPCWAGLIAIANQGREAKGAATFNSPSNPDQTLQALYSLPAGDFHDITTGYNGFSAGAGYDLVTGRGTPIANTLIPDLVSIGLPTVTGISPSAGTTAGGTTVTITGSNFIGTTAVEFGAVKATSFTVVSSTQITAVDPAEPFGTVDVTVTTPGGTSVTSPGDAFTFVVPVASQLTFVPPSSGVAGQPVNPAIQVRVLDQFGNLMSSDNTDRVTVAVASGPGGFASGSTTTAVVSSGVATFSNLVLTAAGGYTLSANAAGGLIGPASNSFTIAPATVNKLAFGQQPMTTSAGAAITPAVTVLIEDPFGNLVSTDSTDMVTVGIASGPGTFTGGTTTTVTASSGIATFSNLHLNTAGTYTLSESATGGLTGPASSSFSITAGAVNHLAVTAMPSSVTAGTGLGLIVTALDQFGNPTSDTGTVTFTSNDPLVATPAAPVTFSGSTAFAVGTLKTATASGWTITATDSTAHSGLSNLVTVTPAAATHFSVTAAPVTGSVAISVASESGATVTITTITAPGFSVGQSVNLAGVGVPGYDGTVMITQILSPTSFMYTALANHLGLAPSGGGTVTSVATTGNAFNVVVTALDPYGNTATAYSGTVKLTSSDAAAIFPVNDYTFTTTGPTPDNGVHTFSATLNTPGTNQAITATDTSNASLVGSTSTGISTVGLYLTAFAATPSGFTATFNKLLNVNQLDYYRFTGQTVLPDLSMTAGTTAVAGSVVVASTATQTTLTFVNSNPLGTTGGFTVGTAYTVTLGSAIQDTGGGQFDGDANGVLAGTSYSVSITPVPASVPTLIIPGFARGPNSSVNVLMPNTGTGIPVTLKDAPANTTSVTFTLDYNPALLNVTGPTSGNLVLTNPATANASGVANFVFSTTTAISTSSAILGQIVANVPNSAASQYKAKALLDLVNLAPTWANDDAVEINADLGDVNADYQVNGSDAGLISGVLSAPSQPAGFAAYALADPALIGSPNSNPATQLKISTADVTLLNRSAANLAPAQIPALPTGLTYTSVAGPDPALSLPPGLAASAGGTVPVPVLIDDARPAGSTGMTEATLALTYDPQVLTVSAADIHLGTVPASGSGWTLTSVVNAATGQLAIMLESATPITQALRGSLVTIDFHLRPEAAPGATSVALVESVDPSGYRLIQTNVFDSQGAFTLNPAPTNGPGDPVAGMLALTAASAPPTPVMTAAGSAPAAGASTAAGDRTVLTENTEVFAEVVPAVTGAAAEEDGAVAVVDAPLAGAVRSAAHAAGGAGTDVVALMASAVAAQQAAGLVFPFGNTLSLSGPVVGAPQLAGPWFLALSRSMADQALPAGSRDEASSMLLPGLLAAVETIQDNLIWDSAGADLDWLSAAVVSPMTGAWPPTSAGSISEATARVVLTKPAALDQYFAAMSNEADQGENEGTGGDAGSQS